MKLVLKGLSKTFNISAIVVTDTEVLLEGVDDLIEAIRPLVSGSATEVAIVPAPEPTLIPAAPTGVKYELAYDCLYTVADLEAAKWTTQQMIDAGYLVPVTEKAAPPAPVEVPAAPPAPEPEVVALAPGEFELDGAVYKMEAIAAGATYKQFTDAKWTKEMLLKHSYMSKVRDLAVSTTPAAPAAPVSTEARTYPFLNDEGDWEDSEGTIYDETKHGMGKDKVPPVTQAGVFKKRRGGPVASAPEAPAAPPAPDTKAPAAPPAPETKAPPAPVTGVIEDEEELDADLESILKQWS